MPTELEGNVKLQRFIYLLSELNHLTVDALKSGKVATIEKMNGVVEEMVSIQSVGTEDAYTAIEEDMQIIRQNFNAVVTMIKSNEKGNADAATNVAVKKFLHNVFDATVRIVYAYGLA
jgi:hypothetical protein